MRISDWSSDVCSSDLPAVAHLFWGAEDFAKARQRMSEVEPERQAGERARLTAPGALVETAGCRRAILLRHFGETPPPTCGNCDNCLNPPAAIDATETARDRKSTRLNSSH